MDIIQGKDFKYDNTCVTIGKFDGIHIGHRRILDKVLELSKKHNYKSTVFTFDFDFFKTEDEKRLNTREEKRKTIEEYGIDILIDYPFDDEIKNKNPLEFVKEVLVAKLGIKCIVVGDNFKFGKGAKGDSKTLVELGQRFGFEVVVLPMVEYEGSQVSSTRIREELGAGHIKEAHEMLNIK